MIPKYRKRSNVGFVLCAMVLIVGLIVAFSTDFLAIPLVLFVAWWALYVLSWVYDCKARGYPGTLGLTAAIPFAVIALLFLRDKHKLGASEALTEQAHTAAFGTGTSTPDPDRATQDTILDLHGTVIRCSACERAYRAPIDKGAIHMKCSCGRELAFDPYEYSTMRELTGGSYYLPDFQENLAKFNCQLVDTRAEALDGYEAMDIKPFRQFPIPERRLHHKYAMGFCELHGLRVMVYIYFYDTLEIYITTTSYIIDPQDEELAISLMEKLKLIVSVRQGPPDKVMPMGWWYDYQWFMTYGSVLVSRNTKNQLLLQLKYKGADKLSYQSELGQPSDDVMTKVTSLNLKANEYGKIGEYQKCIETSEEVLEYWPCNSNARLLIGTALLELGDFRGAEDNLQGAIEYLPQMASPYLTLGRLYFETDKMALAKHYLESYLYICESTGTKAIDDQYPIARELLKEIDT